MYRLIKGGSQGGTDGDMPACRWLRSSTTGKFILDNFQESSLKMGLKENVTWWWCFDLIRRLVINLIDLLAGYLSPYAPIWLRQHLIVVALVVFLVMHVHYKPYESARDGERESLFFRSMPFSRFSFSWLKVGARCNALETFVLCDMILIALLSIDTFDDEEYFSLRAFPFWLVVFSPLIIFLAIKAGKIMSLKASCRYASAIFAVIVLILILVVSAKPFGGATYSSETVRLWAICLLVFLPLTLYFVILVLKIGFCLQYRYRLCKYRHRLPFDAGLTRPVNDSPSEMEPLMS